MAHMIERKNGKYSFAFTGERSEIWHGLGQQLDDNASEAEWIAASGLDYSVFKVMALAQISPTETKETDQRFIVRDDNSYVLGFASDSYQVVQPREVYAWFRDYILIDDRFQIDAAGVLNCGERIWCTARFDGDVTIAGDRHIPRLLMSTSFDCSQPTINQATMTRTVCANTLRLAHSDKRAAIKTRHSTKFDGRAVAKELAQIAQSFADYKALGDAMAQVQMTKEQVSDFFKQLLEIPLNVKAEDISTRKLNMHSDLARCFSVTRRERNVNQLDAWTALQAVTRYVDHDRSVRNADNDIVGRFDSGTFGSGDAMKGRAIDLLKELVA